MNRLYTIFTFGRTGIVYNLFNTVCGLRLKGARKYVDHLFRRYTDSNRLMDPPQAAFDRKCEASLTRHDYG